MSATPRYIDVLRAALDKARAAGATEAELDAVTIDTRLRWHKEMLKTYSRPTTHGLGAAPARKTRRAPGERASI